jgi:ATP-dependent phosphoenolpyruvate carboxykinase
VILFFLFIGGANMINLDKYQNEPEFLTALKEMFSSLDNSVINNQSSQELNDEAIHNNESLRCYL